MRLRHLLAVALIAAAPVAHARQLVVFAAASLANALDEIVAGWEGDVVVAYAASSALARQIEQGAPADLFISADAPWMDYLAGRGLIRPETRTDLLGNRIVLIAHGQAGAQVEIGPDTDLAGMLGDGRLAMADVEAVPAGRYGKAALEHFGLLDSVAGSLAQSENVRAALALVSRGEAPMGIVYATDAAADDAVTVVATFPRESHPPIIYPVAVLTESANPSAAAFAAHLTSDAARAAFEGQGFTVLD